jgi:hypothetical protein
MASLGDQRDKIRSTKDSGRRNDNEKKGNIESVTTGFLPQRGELRFF